MTRSRRTTRGRLATAAASLALLTLAAAPLQAQRCLGFPGFGGQPLRLGGSLSTGGNVTTVGADLAFGQAAGAFAGVGIGMADFDEIDESALLLSGNVGTQLQLGTASSTSSGAQLCPLATLQYQSGPNAGNVDISGLQLTGGASLGTAITMTPGVSLAPFGSAAVAWSRSSVSVGSADDTDSEVGGLIDLGAGLIFNNRFTIRPSVSIPVGFDDSDSRFNLAVGFSFGGNRR